MAVANLLTLIDDIASLLDDVAAMTKIASKKTAGVLGDDLALNAEQVSGVRAERELPVVWAVALGSLRNKAILVPLALLISALIPWLITPLLMVGGAYLCFEGAEKWVEKWGFGHHHADSTEESTEVQDPADFEKQKIKGAIRTDFVLSAEIIVITLGTVAQATLTQQVMTLVAVALLMTVGVYGLVAGIVKMDDVGFWLRRRGGVQAGLGTALVWFAPQLMRFLAQIGTVAMFMVGGGIVAHGIPFLHHWGEGLSHVSAVGWLLPSVLDTAFGVVFGLFLALGFLGFGQLKTKVFAK